MTPPSLGLERYCNFECCLRDRYKGNRQRWLYLKKDRKWAIMNWWVGVRQFTRYCIQIKMVQGAKPDFFISIGVTEHIYSTYDEQTFRSLLQDNRRIGEGKKFKSSYRDKLRQVSSNLLVSTPVKVLQLPLLYILLNGSVAQRQSGSATQGAS